MSLSSIDDVVENTAIVMAGASDSLSSEAMEMAANRAVSELALTLPVTDGVCSYWLVERAKRHMLQSLLTAAAMKFQYKKIHLEHRFLQLSKLIEALDKSFNDFLADNPDVFPLAASTFSDAAYYIPNGEACGTL